MFFKENLAFLTSSLITLAFTLDTQQEFYFDLVNDKEPKSNQQIGGTDGKKEFDEEAILRDRLQQLEIEKHSWLKKRIADLKILDRDRRVTS